MSQQNCFDPSLDLSGQYLDHNSSQPFTDAGLAQWNAHGPRTVYSAPSPSHSLRTGRSAPGSRTPANLKNSHRHAVHQDRTNVGDRAGLDYLQVPPQSSACTSLSNADPFSRFFYGTEDPFSSERMRSSNTSTGYASFPQHNAGFGTYRDTSGSAIGRRAPASDSGYRTLPSQSIVSQEPEGVDQELPPDVYHLGNMHVGPAPSESIDMLNTYGTPSITDQMSQYSGLSGGRGGRKHILCQVPDCGEVFKCNSDFNKHMLRHNKPFRCDEPGCRRDKGFTTKNDLDRHKKSVHRIGQTKNSWKCAGQNCKNPSKIWPRLDNFKQHISRMHERENKMDLIRRSAYHHSESPPIEDSVSVAPMDTSLAGIGTERDLSHTSNELDDPTIPGISLTPDQETCNQWTMNEPSSFTFPMDTGSTAFTSENSGYSFPGEQDTIIPAQMDAGSAATQHDTAFRGLDALAAAATSRSSHAKVVKRQPRLSKAPHTKAEQQKQDLLQRLTKTIAHNLQHVSNQEEGLEIIIKRALANSIGQNPASSRLKQMLSVLGTNEQTPEGTVLGEAESVSGASRRLSRQSSFTSLNLTCDECGVVVARPSDMRKHMKRHTRPYGCTYTSCKKRFGAKSDWKRHENSQHFQLEAFRCCRPPLDHDSANQAYCGELFHRKPLFEAHLRDEHRMTEAKELEKEVRKSRIGKNGQGQFWCGFCEDVIPLTKTRNDAWSERFDHIDVHFCKEDKRIEDWWCVEAKRRKGDVLKDMDSNAFEEDTDGGSSGGDGQGSEVGGKGVQEVGSEAAKKRTGEEEAAQRAHKRSKREVVAFCCICGDGPCRPHTVPSCIQCHHEWCNECTGTMVSVD